MKTLVLCLGCERHVNPDEASCPFCGASVLARPEPPRPARRGLSRAKLHAFHTAALATGVAVAVACGGDSSPTDGGSDGSNNNDSTASDAKSDGTSNNDATTDALAESGSDGSDDASADVADEDHVIPLPYGCVFPGGCKSVTV